MLTTSSNILISKLKRIGVPPRTVSFIYNSIVKRQIHCRFAEMDEVFTGFRVLPQGGVLAQFFLLYTFPNKTL